MNAAQAKAHIATLTSTDELLHILETDARATVVNAAKDRLAALQAEATGTEVATEEAPEQEAPVETDEAAGTEEQASDEAPEVEEQDADDEQADEQDADEAPAAPAADAPWTHSGKATTASPRANYLVKNPNAPGLLGYKGKLYTRAQVSANAALAEAMYRAGCKAVIKAKN
jgi:hypothetical protein